MLHFSGKNKNNIRVFKTKRFDKVAAKALISDDDLCQAIQEVLVGQVVDLGGGVYKKRLNKNAHRSLLLAKGGVVWVYQFLFAKKDSLQARLQRATLGGMTTAL